MSTVVVTNPGDPDALLKLDDGILDLLKIDFNNMYAVSIAAGDERVKMLQLSLTLAAAPFAAVTALLSAKVITPEELTTWKDIPGMIFAFLVGFGLLGVVPLMRFAETTRTHLRTLRAVNNFRWLYSEALRVSIFEKYQWKHSLPVDPTFPQMFRVRRWDVINAFALSSVNAAFLSVGIIGLSKGTDNSDSFSWLLFVVILLLSGGLLWFLVWYLMAGNPSKTPTNPDWMAKVGAADTTST